MMYVTYNLFHKGELIDSQERRNCWHELKYKQWDIMHLRIYTVDSTKQYKDKWLELCKKVEPSLVRLEMNEEEWIEIPYQGNHGKSLLILSLIRYLWESTNQYADIVPVVFEILEKYPKLDVMKAVLIANGSLHYLSGWGHSITKGVAERLPGVWHYRRYKKGNVHDFANTYEGLTNYDLSNKLASEQGYRQDWEPTYKHFKSKKLV